jgi:hypothetical protein
MACGFDPVAAAYCIGIGMGEHQSLLPQWAGSTAAKIVLPDSFGGRLSKHTRLPRLLELADLPVVRHHPSLYCPVIALLSLERLIHVSRAASTAAVGCLLIGRGPYRVLVLLATLWVTFQLWGKGIIHWA